MSRDKRRKNPVPAPPATVPVVDSFAFRSLFRLQTAEPARQFATLVFPDDSHNVANASRCEIVVRRSMDWPIRRCVGRGVP
jgi:hypothetical protein